MNSVNDDCEHVSTFFRKCYNEGQIFAECFRLNGKRTNFDAFLKSFFKCHKVEQKKDFYVLQNSFGRGKIYQWEMR